MAAPQMRQAQCHETFRTLRPFDKSCHLGPFCFTYPSSTGQEYSLVFPPDEVYFGRKEEIS